jgi:hypothetical protein
MRGFLAAAVVVTMLAACGSTSSDLNTGSVVDATPEALVAVGLSHVADEPTDIQFYRRTDEIDDQGAKSPYIGGIVGFEGAALSLQVQKLSPELPTCDDGSECHRVGSATLTWSVSGEDVPGYVTVYVDADGERRSAGLEDGAITKDPRNIDLPVDVDELASIVTDPAFALRTRQGAVTAGKALPALAKRLEAEKRERAKERRAARPPSTTPRSLAAQVADILTMAAPDNPVVAGRPARFSEPDEQVADGWGIELTLRDGVRVHVSLVPAIGPGVNGCRPSLTCWTADGRRLLGRPGLAGTFRSNRETATSVHVWVEGPTVAPTSKDYFVAVTGDETPAQSVVQATFVIAETVGPTTQRRWIEAGKKLDWFRRP